MDLAARRLGSKMTPEHSKNHCRNLAIRTSGVKNDPRQVLVASKICHQWGSGVKMIPHSFRNPCRSLTTWASGVKYDPRHFWKVCDRVTIWASGVKTDPSKYIWVPFHLRIAGRVPLFPGLSGQGRGGGQPAELSYFKLSSFVPVCEII